jgi:hypothetical protein
VWPTEPAKAAWSFNKWQISKIPKDRRQRLLVMRLRCRSGREWAAAPVAVVAQVDVAAAVVPAAVEVARAAALVAAEALLADRVAADARAGLVARAADAVVTASHGIAMVGVATAAASSSRT